MSWEVAHRDARALAQGALLIDLAALSFDELRDAAIDDLPADIAEALRRAAPGVDLAEIVNYPAAGLEGLLNAVKGALFEQQVIEGLESGRLGDIALPEGATARLLAFTEPGVDVEIRDVGVTLEDVSIGSTS